MAARKLPPGTSQTLGPGGRSTDAQASCRDLNWLRQNTAATISVAATAEVLGVDRRTVQRGIADEQLPVVRIGHRLLVPRLPLLAMLTEPPQAGGLLASAPPASARHPHRAGPPHAAA